MAMKLQRVLCPKITQLLVVTTGLFVFASAGYANAPPTSVVDSAIESVADAANEVDEETVEQETVEQPLNLNPELIEQSPVLQRWLDEIPNVADDIRNDPSFKTRVQAGYTFFPSSDSTGGFILGVEDWFIGDTPLTVSADYQENFRGDRTAYGADLHYYLMPLGGYFNVAPTVGYRFAEAADDYSVNGANLGVRLRVVPSRTAAADITLDQSWIVGDSESLSITQLNVGYALSQDLRLSTDFEWQSTADEGDSRVGINLEWAL
ncbi:MAG: hypothetical protein AAF171_23020 [Cyanobacteria bacterium P01_A01_bin.116]